MISYSTLFSDAYYVTLIILAPSGSPEAKIIIERPYLGNDGQRRGGFLLFLAKFGFIILRWCFNSAILLNFGLGSLKFVSAIF